MLTVDLHCEVLCGKHPQVSMPFCVHTVGSAMKQKLHKIGSHEIGPRYHPDVTIQWGLQTLCTTRNIKLQVRTHSGLFLSSFGWMFNFFQENLKAQGDLRKKNETGLR